jgi:hypothetical protein
MEMVIVTAASPTQESAKAIAEEVRRLGLGAHFGVDFEATKSTVLDYASSLGQVALC